MRTCPNCGANVADTDDFCGNCGTYLGWITPESPEPEPAPADPAGPSPAADQPGAVAPAKPVTQRTRSTGQVTETAQNGPPCKVCGTANPIGAKFCRRCAAPLTETAPVAERRRWRGLRKPRWLRWGGGGSPWPRRLVVLLVLVALVVAGIVLYPLAGDLVQNVRDKLATPAAVSPVRETASAAVPGHPVSAAVDGATNRYWGAPAVGAWAQFDFAPPFRLLGVAIHTGASTVPSEFDAEARPTALDLVVSTSDGTTTTLPISLADKPGAQSTDTGISNVIAIRVVIRAAAGMGAGKDIALGEIEFFKRP